MDKKLLGIHILTKNEETVLGRCLESIRQIADEVIVIDTGSTDRSVEIACSHGAKVVTAPWDDDFAVARNVGLSHASTAWVLILDADEQIVAGHEQICTVLQETTANQCSVCIENLYGERPEERVLFHAPRLFRTETGYRFVGRLHEQLVATSSDHASTHSEADAIPASPLRLLHTGYLPDELARKQKAERNLRILQRLLSDSPDDAFHLYNLGVTYCQLGMAAETGAVFQRAYQAVPIQAPFRPTLIRDWAQVLVAMQQYELLGQLLKQETVRYADYPDLLLFYGKCLEWVGLLQDAFDAYAAAVRCGQTTGHSYVTEAGASGFRAYTAMAHVAKRLGNQALADQCYQQALRSLPSYEPALTGWADLLEQCGYADHEIAERLQKIVQPETKDGWKLIATALIFCGAFDPAIEVIHAGMSVDSVDCSQLYECYVSTGRYRDAARLVEQTKTAKTQLDLALAYWADGTGLPPAFHHGNEPGDVVYSAFDCWLRTDLQPDTLEGVGDEFLQRGQDCIDRAIELGVPDLAMRMARMNARFCLPTAKSLYRHGYPLRAADPLLTAMEQGRQDVEGLFMIGEMIYEKGFYGQAASLFEQALSLDASHRRARIGAADSYMQLARAAAIESTGLFPDCTILNEDGQRLQQGLLLLEGTDWRTQRNGRQRRNMRNEQADFAVHDRQG